MKKLLAFPFLLLTLSACAAQPAYNCGQGVCTQLQVVEPVLPNQPLTVVITVTADKDIPGLGVSLSHDADGEVQGPQGWESDVTDGTVWGGGAAWKANARANQALRFTRKIRLPPRGEFFGIAASASILGKGPVATDSAVVYLTGTGGTVYPSGTSIPYTPKPLPRVTPWPTPTSTRVPTPTSVPTPTRAPYP